MPVSFSSFSGRPAVVGFLPASVIFRLITVRYLPPLKYSCFMKILISFPNLIQMVWDWICLIEADELFNSCFAWSRARFTCTVDCSAPAASLPVQRLRLPRVRVVLSTPWRRPDPSRLCIRTKMTRMLVVGSFQSAVGRNISARPLLPRVLLNCCASTQPLDTSSKHCFLKSPAATF